MKQRIAVALVGLLLLAGCDSMPDWLSGGPRVIKRTPGERIDVVFNQTRITPDSDVADVPIDIPEQANLAEWISRNDAMQTPHLGLTGITHAQHVTIGDGSSFTGTNAPTPIVANGTVVAMDAAGVVSAHDETAIDTVRWTNRDSLSGSSSDMLGGGLAYADGVIYATTGHGGLRAIMLDTGKLIWTINVGAPVHGAPAAGNGIVAVLTADNQTIAVDAKTGATRWTHRGIREAASYFSTTSPVISGGMVIAAYSSGEVFCLRAETGSVVWTDTLGATIKTRASAVFNGIDADPIVQDGVVVVVSTSGEMQASALANGRPLWQKRIGAHNTPWSAGNALFVLSDTHDVAALFKRDGQVRWSQSLSTSDERDATKDTTPALFGPILAGNAVLVLDNKGVLTTFKPLTGERIGTYELAPNTATTPIIANGALYYVTRDAVLYRYH